ncbi:MAG: MFS transporter [Lachnospiraceae bacterium]|nr:MFS transporter [Lachnospiraceae bacterium]
MKKLTKKRQMLVYAIGGMGVNMLNLMMGSYLLSAIIASGFGEEAIKTQTFSGPLGLSQDLVIAGAWAVLTVIAKVIDGVIDIPMASFTDNLKSRFGRRRPALIIGLVPMIIAYVLFTLLTPEMKDASLLNTIYYFVVLCIFYTSYTLTMVTYYATFTEIVDTVEERNFISNVKSVCDIVYFILGYVVVAAMLKGMNIRLVAMIILPIVLTMMIPIFMIKERSTLPEDVEKEENTKEKHLKTVNLFQSIAATFKNKNYILWLIVYSFMTFGVQLFLSGINEFFSVSGMNMMTVMICAFGPVPLTLMIYNKLIKKYGFGVAFAYTLVIFGLAMLGMYFIARMEAGTAKTAVSIIGGLLSSLAIGALFAVAYSVPSQLAADEEKRTGISNSAMYFAVQGLFAGVASGIGGGMTLTLLKTSEPLIAGTKNTIFITLIASVAMLVSLILMVFLPKTVLKMGKQESGSDKK